MADKPRKILIIRFSSIGDIVLTTPVIRCLHEQLEGVELHYVTKEKYSGLLRHNPRICKLHTLTDAGLQPLIKVLRAERFDFVVDLHNSLRSKWSRVLLGVKGKSFYKLNLQKWLLVRFKINRIPPLHVVDRYLAAAKPLGVNPDGQGMEMYLPLEQPKVDDILAHFQHPPAAFAIGGNYTTKKLPVDKISEVILQLDHPTLLLGGAEDTPNAKEIVRKVGANAVDLTGQLSLLESAGIIRACSAVITHDTGMMHIAAAFKKPILSVWGNTVPAFGMTPYVGNDELAKMQIHRFEVCGLSCRPCSKLGFAKCPKGHFRCMQYQDTTRIAGIALHYLSSKPT